MVKIAQNTAHILPNGTNTGPGVVQVDDSWTFGQVLAVVMIIVNVKEVLHYLWGEPARERQAQTEEVAHRAVGLRPQPQPATTFALIPPIQLSAPSHSALLHYTGFSTDTYTTHRGGIDMAHQVQGLQPFAATSSGSGFRLGLTLTGHSHERYTSGYTVYSSSRRIPAYGQR